MFSLVEKRVISGSYTQQIANSWFLELRCNDDYHATSLAKSRVINILAKELNKKGN